jgi:hypothetical protein
MIEFQDRKQEALRLIASAGQSATELRQGEAERRLREVAVRLARGRLMVVVAGEFKQGKSSLINALLAEPGLFPVNVDVTTSLVSTITYGERERVMVVLGKPGGQGKEVAISRGEIGQYVTEQGNPQNQREARMLVIESPNPQLKEGLMLVDTPGVGGLNERHTEVSYAFIPTADAVLYISDAMEPLSAKEIEFIRDRIARHCQNLIFVVTKKDSNRDYRTIVADNRQKLAAALQRPADAIPVIAVSSRTRLTYLQSHDPEDLAASNFPALEAELWNLLGEQRGRVLLLSALGKLGETLAELRLPLQVEWEACQQRDQRELDELQRRFEETRQRAQRLLENNAEWQIQLSNGLTDIRMRLLERYREGFKRIRRQAEDFLESERLVNESQKLGEEVERSISELVIDLTQVLSREAAQLNDAIASSAQFKLSTTEIAIRPGAASLEQRTHHEAQASWWGKAVRMARVSTYDSVGGGVVGAVLGLATGAVLGFFTGGAGAVPGYYIGATLGGILGTLTGARSGLKQVQAEDRASARREWGKVVGRYIDDSQQNCENALGHAVTDLERSMREELKERIAQEKQTCEGVLRTLQETRRLNQQQAAARAAQLAVPLQRLDAQMRAAEELARAVDREGRPAEAAANGQNGHAGISAGPQVVPVGVPGEAPLRERVRESWLDE